MNTPNCQSSLTTWIDWLLQMHAEEIDLGLDRIRQVANSMQVTRPAPFVISVAGTNGKGSSVAMLASILKHAGYQVGTYTSPHILRFNERIQVNGVSVSDEVIVNAFNTIESQRHETKLTYFEFSTLAALQVFNEMQLDVVILEVGLGGRLDAVNVVDADASLITAIDVDHIEWLGDDRNLIALEKAGIMRAQQCSVCSDPNPPQTLLEFAEKLDVDFTCLGKDFSYAKGLKKSGFWQFKKFAEKSIEMQLNHPALQGEFQLQNASGVIALLLQVKNVLPVTIEQMNLGLQKVRHAGRMELFALNNQSWLIDVAHNPQSAKALANFLSTQTIVQQERVAIFSALSDKDMLPMVKAVAPYVGKWLIADLAIPRSSSLTMLRETLSLAGVQPDAVCEFESIKSAVLAAKSLSSKQVLVWGSFFTVSQTIETIEGLPD